MKIIGVDHFTINVQSLEESTRFYQQTMQLEKLELVDMGDHIIQYFKLDNQNILELIQYKYNTEHIITSPDCRGIYRHLAIRVEDLQELYTVIASDPSVTILMQPSYCEKLRFRNFLFRDPSGVEIEILERDNSE